MAAVSALTANAAIGGQTHNGEAWEASDGQETRRADQAATAAAAATTAAGVAASLQHRRSVGCLGVARGWVLLLSLHLVSITCIQ